MQVVFLALAFLAVSGSATSETITVGIVNNNEPGFRAEVLTPTLSHLSAFIPGVKFSVVEIAAYQAADDISRTSPDFVIAPSDIFLELINSAGAQALAVRKSPYANDANQSVGSTLVVLKNRDDIHSLADLQGKTISAPLPDSLGGWLALQGELKKQGYDPEHFFKKQEFVTYQIPEVVQQVLEGRTDAGVLSACLLETAESTGLITPGMLKVIGEHDDHLIACRHSTNLYPDQVFGALNYSKPDLVRRVTVSLLSMTGSKAEPKHMGTTSAFSWQVPGKFDQVSGLYKMLEIGPWAYMRDWSPKGILKRFWKEILFAIGFLALLALHEVRLKYLVKKRTAQLSAAVEEKAELIDQLRGMTNKVATLQRHSLVSQLSSIIAHELKQPIATIINYCTVQKILAEKDGEEESQYQTVSQAINKEALRMSEIVDRVRSYAKGKETQHKRCDLVKITQNAFETFKNYQDYFPNIQATLIPRADIAGDSLELEILVLNLLKNAGRSVKKQKGGHIRVGIYDTGETYTLVVEDNGPELSDEEFQRILDRGDSTSSSGLGLGLSIVRAIVDAHSGSIRFGKAIPHGLKVTVVFDKF